MKHDKNYQEALYSEEDNSDKRIYDTETNFCHVKIHKTFLKKTNNAASRLFNHCIKEAITSPELHYTWYSSEPLGVTTFTNVLPDISKQDGNIE